MISAKFKAGMTIQLAAMNAALADGMPRRGWKIGINVPEIRERLELPHPGVGWLNGDRVFRSGSELRIAAEEKLFVEAEMAIEFSRTVRPDCSRREATSSIASTYAALEVVDYGRTAATLDDVVGNSMFHHSTILGPRNSSPGLFELEVGFPIIRVGDNEFSPERHDLVPAATSEIVVFAAKYLDAFGQELQRGDLLISGSYFEKALPLAAGDEVVADFGGLGSVSVKVAT